MVSIILSKQFYPCHSKLQIKTTKQPVFYVIATNTDAMLA